MSQNNKVGLKTLAIKARVANQIRTKFYKKYKDHFTKEQKVEIFDEIFDLNHVMHWELISYKKKRKYDKELMNKRLSAPQTKTMQKKVAKYKKDLEDKKK